MKKPILFSFFIVALLFFLGYHYYLSALRFSGSEQGNRVLLTIAPGEGVDSIAKFLKKQELIRSTTVFKLYTRYYGLVPQIKAGRFVIPPHSDLKSIVGIITSGKSIEFAVTIPEGFTAEEIAGLLEKQELTTRHQFLACLKTCSFDVVHDFLPKNQISLEGYLFPDTYFINPATYSDKVFIERLLNNFYKRMTAEDWQKVQKGPYTLDQIVIMASIVEAEERSEKNRPIVAGILWKRYENNAGLGADATLRYVLKKDTEGLTQADLKSLSPYNTRKFRDLPPTPIGNPGLSSIHAALYPKSSEYWYYLHGTEGIIHYGRTLEEHNENKRRYL